MNRWTIMVIALVGAIASASSAAVSYAEVVGGVPAFLFRTYRQWFTLYRLGSVPAEFLAFVWFAAVCVLYGAGFSRRMRTAGPLVCLTGVPVAGLGVWFLVTRQLSWPVLIATVAGGLIVAITAVAREAWAGKVIGALRADASGMISSPWARTSVAGFAAIVVAFGWTLELFARGVSPAEAYDRDCRRWYFSQSADLPPDLARVFVGERTIKVVAFTDYQSKLAPNLVLQRADQVEAARTSGLAVEYEVRDFPMDPKCNPARLIRAGEASCEAAYAARLVETVRGPKVAREMASWLYGRGQALSAQEIHQRLAEMGLSEEFERRRPEFEKAVAADIALARRLGVRWAPAFFVNGVEIPQGPGMLQRVLRYEQENRKTTTAAR